jgi:hypothetical protein
MCKYETVILGSHSGADEVSSRSTAQRNIPEGLSLQAVKGST